MSTWVHISSHSFLHPFIIPYLNTVLYCTVYSQVGLGSIFDDSTYSLANMLIPRLFGLKTKTTLHQQWVGGEAGWARVGARR